MSVSELLCDNCINKGILRGSHNLYTYLTGNKIPAQCDENNTFSLLAGLHISHFKIDSIPILFLTAQKMYEEFIFYFFWQICKFLSRFNCNSFALLRKENIESFFKKQFLFGFFYLLHRYSSFINYLYYSKYFVMSNKNQWFVYS